jgi:DNA-binding response OmpR family regulator
LYFDRDKIEKLLYNLLSNAFKFTRNGGIIEIVLNKIENVDQLFSEGHVELQVIDSGIGMTSKKLKTIFDPYRDEATRTYNKELSSSIGLSIVKSMTDLHRGKIDVHSEYGKGTRFVVRLPLGHLHLKNGEIIEDFKNSDAPVHYQVGTSGEAHPGYLPGHDSVAKSKTQARLLIVEDSMDIQQYMVDIFESQYDLLLAANGNDGFTQAIKYNPDLIISDIMMPEMNGIELCSRLKQELKTSHIPIILLSARTSLIFKVNGLETGADDYVSKPFSPQLLELKVKNLLRSREILRERFRKEATFNLSSIAVTSADERFLEHLIQLVQENMKNPEFGINFLSSELNITRVQLYRKIKALTNMTATEFVRQIRLIKAARLLTTTFLNINEVSYEIGFQDPSYFRKCFKQMYGHNPSKYRTN